MKYLFSVYQGQKFAEKQLYRRQQPNTYHGCF